MEFQAGQKVEVMIAEEGFENSYYAATVLSREDGLLQPKYRVVYDTILKDDESGPLEERVDAEQLRPEPPHVPATCFSLYELADAYDGDGWWVGVVYGVFGSNYFLLHPATEEEKPYPLEKLRVHHDWGAADGQWILRRGGVHPNVIGDIR